MSLKDVIEEKVYELIKNGVKEKYLEKEIMEYLGKCYFCQNPLINTECNFNICICGCMNCDYGYLNGLIKDTCKKCFYHEVKDL